MTAPFIDVEIIDHYNPATMEGGLHVRLNGFDLGEIPKVHVSSEGGQPLMHFSIKARSVTYTKAPLDVAD